MNPSTGQQEIIDDANHVDQIDETVIKQICDSKAEEIRMLGYKHVQGADIWSYLCEEYEKKGYPRLHRIVNDILSLKATTLMNWLTISAYKGNIKF